uniref:Uncharacterized protein n=1 Tax=Tanacetum cinerariifolium TaxID=118510 RepID=A0A6L2KN34_TANCI|nr:hypothetical protein [Tanacetum cinerariifolium]
MRIDELHKFIDGTLDFVRTALHDIASGIRMEYLPKKNWSRLDKRRAWVMVQNINKQLFKRRLMRNLEKFIGDKRMVAAAVVDSSEQTAVVAEKLTAAVCVFIILPLPPLEHDQQNPPESFEQSQHRTLEESILLHKWTLAGQMDSIPENVESLRIELLKVEYSFGNIEIVNVIKGWTNGNCTNI